MKRHILHVDCNCFYASVEMQEHPKLRGKAIAVCGDPEKRHGIILTASYPAKRMGVKTGMAIWEAQQHCRDLILVPAHMSEYIRYSGFAREIYEDYTDRIEPFGLDESWLDVTGIVEPFASPVALAQEISDRFKRELGITVSIGVAENKITAKLGSDYKKPDAITRIETDNYKEIVYPLPVEDLLYVGPATQRKLNRYGINTIGRLAETDPEALHGWLGKIGYVLSDFARGLDQTPVRRMGQSTVVKSVGNSCTTPRDLTSPEDVWLMLLILSESVASRMRALDVKGMVVEVAVRDTNLLSFVRQRKLDNPICISKEIAEVAFDLFQRNYSWRIDLRSIGVRVAGLVPRNECVQISLFTSEEKRVELERLDEMVDLVRRRYGYMSVQRAVTYTDPVLGRINPRDDHTVHPVGYFHAG